ncbi:hypothetical protein [[Micrococcus luteus] ATCC 49442]|uniref:hypothetical protein n=1 Tax=[Micrococcus luteus] ATCC 49442 TaxID=2698727 RepID=UPI001FCAE260|nr:hypothetical protein [[Micrococcus luteus] ATCC 49442]
MTVGLRSFFTRHRTPVAGESSAVVVATEREPLTPAQLADLEWRGPNCVKRSKSQG